MNCTYWYYNYYIRLLMVIVNDRPLYFDNDRDSDLDRKSIGYEQKIALFGIWIAGKKISIVIVIGNN